MGNWSIGALEHWREGFFSQIGASFLLRIGGLRSGVGALEHWSIGALEHWSIGALGGRMRWGCIRCIGDVVAMWWVVDCRESVVVLLGWMRRGWGGKGKGREREGEGKGRGGKGISWGEVRCGGLGGYWGGGVRWGENGNGNGDRCYEGGGMRRVEMGRCEGGMEGAWAWARDGIGWVRGVVGSSRGLR